jgi:outer membrane biosynthesis protein TonB
MSESQRHSSRRKIVHAVGCVVGALALSASVGVHAASSKKVVLPLKPLTSTKLDALKFNPFKLNNPMTFIGPVQKITNSVKVESEKDKNKDKSPKKPKPPPPPPPPPPVKPPKKK